LVNNLKNLEPTIQALADVGPDFDAAIAYATVFPYGQNLIDRGIRGDFINLFTTVDISGPRLRKSFFLGTRLDQEGRDLVPMPGEPFFQRYTYDPMGRPLAPPPAFGPLGPVPPGNPGLNADPPGASRSLPGPGSYPAGPPAAAPLPLPSVTGPVLPMVPQENPDVAPLDSPPPPAGGGPIFAGPYAGGGS
jgi:phospholipid/cholesterol/gamma-HCH transport system substrate-binding protein